MRCASLPEVPNEVSREVWTALSVLGFRPIKVHLAPSCAKRRAMAAPIPREAPVMMHLLPSRDFIVILGKCCWVLNVPLLFTSDGLAVPGLGRGPR